jgi:hypothetical protein
MTESTTSNEQRIANAILWIESLKSGEYKKGIGALGVEKEGEWTYCCLGVGCKALNIDENYARGYSYKLIDLVGLTTEIGYFDNHNDSLTNSNDNVYKDDTDFTNMVRIILDNIDYLFMGPVAEGLKKHYGL